VNLNIVTAAEAVAEAASLAAVMNPLARMVAHMLASAVPHFASLPPHVPTCGIHCFLGTYGRI